MSHRKLICLIFASFLGGAYVGVLLTLHLTRKPEEPHHEVRYSQLPYYDPWPEQLLYKDGTTLEEIYPDEGFRATIRNPDEIWIHRVGGDGQIHVGEYRFSSKASPPTQETSKRLIHALCSLSSYEPPGKMCTFNPGVLLRLKKDGRTYDMMFCFDCRQIQASANGGADMSIQGCKTFLKCFCDTLPDFGELREVRKKLEVR